MEKHRLTWGMIIANVIVFLLVFSMPENMIENVFAMFSFSGGNSLQIWRWFTALFLHAGASHLFFNMLGLYFFGKHLEEEVKPQWFLAIYFISGIIGSVAFMLTSPVQVVGASGCVFGVMGAAMLLNPSKNIHFYIFPLPLGLVAIIFAMIETVVIFVQPDFGNVAHVAHLGGLSTGAIFAFTYDWRRAFKGLFALGICVLIFVVLAPIIGLITGLAGFALDIIDRIIGAVLYSVAMSLSFLWA